MSEVEQLRKEVNELRERIAKLEAMRAVQPMLPNNGWPHVTQPPVQPYWTHDIAKQFPPGTVLC